LTGPLSLRIAGDPVHLSTARSFAGSVGRVLGMADSERHDLRLAISELATTAIKAGAEDLSLIVDFTEEKTVFLLQAEGGLPPSIPRETSDLLAALFDGSIWSAREPWVIRMGRAPDDA
jgi:hypothetical protein